MPISPKFIWDQDNASIRLRVSLNNAKLDTANVYVSDVVVKVNAPPYFLLLDLLHEIDPTSFKIKKVEQANELFIVLHKIDERVWSNLCYKDDRKLLVAERRLTSINNQMAKEREMAAKTGKHKQEEGRNVLQAQMKVDEKKHQILADLKSNEKRTEEMELYESLRSLQETAREREAPVTKQSYFKAPVDHVNGNVSTAQDLNFALSVPDLDNGGLQEVQYLPRAETKATLKFTERLFPTPLRESKSAEEQEWLFENRKHLVRTRSREEAVNDISEDDPMWLKAKGDEFFHNRDFASANNAYSKAISCSEDNTSLFTARCLANRSACWLNTCNLEKCIEDCSKALAHLPDTRYNIVAEAVERNRLKMKLHARRGAAYFSLGIFCEARADYSVAIKLDTGNKNLKKDDLRIKDVSRAHEVKLEGDAMLLNGQHDVAMLKYSEALKINPVALDCLSNRAVCYLATGQERKCISDCTAALYLLQQTMNESCMNSGFVSVSYPLPECRKHCVLTLLVRRGMAYASIELWEKAIEDYSAAATIDPENSSLKCDLESLRQHM